MNSSEVSEHFRYYSISFQNSNKFAKPLYLPRNRQLKRIFHQNSYLCDSIHLRSSVIIIVTAWTITDVTVAMAKRHTTLYLMWRWITQSYAYHRRTIGQMIQCCMSLYLSCLIQSSNKSGLNCSSDKKKLSLLCLLSPSSNHNSFCEIFVTILYTTLMCWIFSSPTSDSSVAFEFHLASDCPNFLVWRI